MLVFWEILPIKAPLIFFLESWSGVKKVLNPPYLNDLESEFEELSSSEEEKETSNENVDEASKTVEVTKVQGESSEEESSEEESSEEDSFEESESEDEQPVKAVG